MRAANPNVVVAHSAGLRYVTDQSPGIARIRRGKSFSYSRPDGRPVQDPATLQRIRSLAIPPAWSDVWICPYANGHIQATGRDAAGRKQPRYHSNWRSTRDGAKYEHVIAFAKALPRIRRRTAADLRRPGLPRERVVALTVRLLEKTLIRVGNDEYARDHHHFGLTTFRNDHVHIRCDEAVFDFTGKSGIRRHVRLHDSHLVRLIKSCHDLPGHHLFRYRDKRGKIHNINSTDVNDYLHRVAGNGFTAKDFRTWAGTVLAAGALQSIGPGKAGRARKNIILAIQAVARHLGNTPAVCRKCYIHPAIFSAYLDGSLLRNFEDGPSNARRQGRSASVLRLLIMASRQGN